MRFKLGFLVVSFLLFAPLAFSTSIGTSVGPLTITQTSDATYGTQSWPLEVDVPYTRVSYFCFRNDGDSTVYVSSSEQRATNSEPFYNVRAYFNVFGSGQNALEPGQEACDSSISAQPKDDTPYGTHYFTIPVSYHYGDDNWMTAGFSFSVIATEHVECGDGTCTDGSEDCSSCSSDCGICVVCGDGVCSDGSEDCLSCSQDCECTYSEDNGVCESSQGETCRNSDDCVCGVDEQCNSAGECEYASMDDLPIDDPTGPSFLTKYRSLALRVPSSFECDAVHIKSEGSWISENCDVYGWTIHYVQSNNDQACGKNCDISVSPGDEYRMYAEIYSWSSQCFDSDGVPVWATSTGCPTVCGDDDCEGGETCTSCSDDCGCCSGYETYQGDCVLSSSILDECAPDSESSAKSITLPYTHSKGSCRSDDGDYDWYTFYLPSTSTVTVQTSPQGGDLTVYIRNSYGTNEGSYATMFTGENSMTKTLNKGTYKLLVIDVGEGTPANYYLKVSTASSSSQTGDDDDEPEPEPEPEAEACTDQGSLYKCVSSCAGDGCSYLSTDYSCQSGLTCCYGELCGQADYADEDETEKICGGTGFSNAERIIEGRFATCESFGAGDTAWYKISAGGGGGEIKVNFNPHWDLIASIELYDFNKVKLGSTQFNSYETSQTAYFDTTEAGSHYLKLTGDAGGDDAYFDIKYNFLSTADKESQPCEVDGYECRTSCMASGCYELASTTNYYCKDSSKMCCSGGCYAEEEEPEKEEPEKEEVTGEDKSDEDVSRQQISQEIDFKCTHGGGDYIVGEDDDFLIAVYNEGPHKLEEVTLEIKHSGTSVSLTGVAGGYQHIAIGTLNPYGSWKPIVEKSVYADQVGTDKVVCTLHYKKGQLWEITNEIDVFSDSSSMRSVPTPAEDIDEATIKRAKSVMAQEVHVKAERRYTQQEAVMYDRQGKLVSPGEIVFVEPESGHLKQLIDEYQGAEKESAEHIDNMLRAGASAVPGVGFFSDIEKALDVETPEAAVIVGASAAAGPVGAGFEIGFNFMGAGTANMRRDTKVQQMQADLQQSGGPVFTRPATIYEQDEAGRATGRKDILYTEKDGVKYAFVLEDVQYGR